MAEAGMELQPTTTDFATLQNAMLHSADTQYNMYNLATGFATANSPWYYFSSDEAWMGNYNNNWIADQELNDAVVPMKSIPMMTMTAGWKPGRTSSRSGTRSCPTSRCTLTSTTTSPPRVQGAGEHCHLGLAERGSGCLGHRVSEKRTRISK